jgi:hypothetical protein
VQSPECGNANDPLDKAGAVSVVMAPQWTFINH